MSDSVSKGSYLMPMLRITGILEGLSFLLLLFVAMPLKYLAGKPAMVQLTGAIHGGLFVLYVVLAVWAWQRFRWRALVPVQAVIASLLPFGTFWMDCRFAELAAQPSDVD